MGSVGGGELLLIFLVTLLLFGAKRIPEIARGLGRGIREFKDAVRDIQRELTDPSHTARRSPPGQTAAPYTTASRAAAPRSPVDDEAPQRSDAGDTPPASASEAEGAIGPTA